MLIFRSKGEVLDTTVAELVAALETLGAADEDMNWECLGLDLFLTLCYVFHFCIALMFDSGVYHSSELQRYVRNSML